MLNQPGGAGAVAIKAVAPAAPDGHTLYMSLATNFIALPGAAGRISRSTCCAISCRSDMSAIIRWCSRRASDLGVNTLAELIALAKKRKGELNFAAGNRGSILHLAAEWLRSATGIEVTLVHYPSASQAITDILGGRVHAMVDAVPAHARRDRGWPAQAARGRDQASGCGISPICRRWPRPFRASRRSAGWR